MGGKQSPEGLCYRTGDVRTSRLLLATGLEELSSVPEVEVLVVGGVGRLGAFEVDVDAADGIVVERAE